MALPPPLSGGIRHHKSLSANDYRFIGFPLLSRGFQKGEDPFVEDMHVIGLLTADELGEALAVSADTVRAWAREGRIPVVRITARTLRFDWQSVLRALAQRQTQTFCEDRQVLVGI